MTTFINIQKAIYGLGIFCMPIIFLKAGVMGATFLLPVVIGLTYYAYHL